MAARKPASDTGFRVRIFKKATGQPSVTWENCVVTARSDGRWATAYAGSATMVIPEDFSAALQQDPAAHAL